MSGDNLPGPQVSPQFPRVRSIPQHPGPWFLPKLRSFPQSPVDSTISRTSVDAMTPLDSGPWDSGYFHL